MKLHENQCTFLNPSNSTKHGGTAFHICEVRNDLKIENEELNCQNLADHVSVLDTNIFHISTHSSTKLKS